MLIAPSATNIVLQDVCPLNLDEHLPVAFDPRVARIILNALDPAHPQAGRLRPARRRRLQRPEQPLGPLGPLTSVPSSAGGRRAALPVRIRDHARLLLRAGRAR